MIIISALTIPAWVTWVYLLSLAIGQKKSPNDRGGQRGLWMEFRVSVKLGSIHAVLNKCAHVKTCNGLKDNSVNIRTLVQHEGPGS
jgi:hypothetical protein